MSKETNSYEVGIKALTEREKEEIALSSETKAETLLELAFDSSEKVRALVGINKNTPEVILMELKNDSSILVQRTATYNLSSRGHKNKELN